MSREKKWTNITEQGEKERKKDKKMKVHRETEKKDGMKERAEKGTKRRNEGLER